jgi:hypothetical protein
VRGDVAQPELSSTLCREPQSGAIEIDYGNQRIWYRGSDYKRRVPATAAKVHNMQPGASMFIGSRLRKKCLHEPNQRLYLQPLAMSTLRWQPAACTRVEQRRLLWRSPPERPTGCCVGTTILQWLRRKAAVQRLHLRIS